MGSFDHLGGEAKALLDASLDDRLRLVMQESFILHPGAVSTLKWMRYAYAHEYGKTRPMGVHLMAAPGMGKSTLFKRYYQSYTPGSRDESGRKYREVILVQAPHDGDYRKLCAGIINQCIPGMELGRGAQLFQRMHSILSMSGVRQILIDEAGNLLHAGKKSHAVALSVLKGLSNEGYSLCIATVENMRNVLAADEQLSSRFKLMHLPVWKESQDLRQLLKGLEMRIPLPEPSGLSDRETVRWLMSNRYKTTGDIVELLQRTARIAIASGAPCLSLKLLEQARLDPDPAPAPAPDLAA